MAMLGRPPHPPDIFSRKNPHDLYNSLPASPQATPLRDFPKQDAPTPLSGAHLPPQYGRPLQRTNSYPPRGSPKIEDGDALMQSEHMLRRKTPNGVLTGAYDGTSVAQSEGPPAMKHIRLPVLEHHRIGQSSTPQNALRTELPLRSPNVQLGGGYANATPNAPWPVDEQSQYNLPAAHWGNIQAQIPQIDSMLHQVPTHNIHMQYPLNGQPFYGFLPPSIQTPPGPTASNDPGLPGPYWPDGRFVPYRPAAQRDLRFHHPHVPNWSSSLGTSNTLGNAEWQRMGTSLAGHRPMAGGQNGFQTPLNMSGSLTPAGRYFTPSKPGLSRSDSYFSQPRHPLPLDAHNPSLAHPLHGYPDVSTPMDSSGQSTPRGPTSGSSILAEYGPQSNNAQLRERVFSYAHGIYLDLLKCLHHARKSGHGRHHNGHRSQPNIYPKPPRQPAAEFSMSPISGQQTYDSRSRRINGNIGGENALSNGFLNQRGGTIRSGNGPWSQNNGQAYYPVDNRNQQGFGGSHSAAQSPSRLPVLRRTSGFTSSPLAPSTQQIIHPTARANEALDALTELCQDSGWSWIDGMLLGGCLAYALTDYQKAMKWYTNILQVENTNVEAMSNLAATFLAVGRRHDAEQYWLKAVKLRPAYFEAAEHLIGLLGQDHRVKEAVQIIEFIERALQNPKKPDLSLISDANSERSTSASRSPFSEISDKPVFDYDGDLDSNFKDLQEFPGANQPGFGSSGYAIPGSDNGRILQLIHAKGNMLYAMGDNVGAAKAFDNAVLIGAGARMGNIEGLIKKILRVISRDNARSSGSQPDSADPILLSPDRALQTAKLLFPSNGELPGMEHLPREGQARKGFISTTSNSLLSLAKIFQDGMATNSPRPSAYHTTYGVREILALYYLSLALQPSPSTANNVGILLASVQQAPPKEVQQAAMVQANNQALIPGVVPGSGIALALLYYNFGLNLDQRHAHLFTNLGSLLKDIGQLQAAIKMYEHAVQCDGNFDIALANLANAVKDQGRIADAIMYYKRAVAASPDFAEAVCGLANALNSVCGWQGRGGIVASGGKRDRWHVNDDNMLLDATQPGAKSSGWIKRVVDLVERQLADGEDWGKGSMDARFAEKLLSMLPVIAGYGSLKDLQESLRSTLSSWAGQKWEGARIVRLTERTIRCLGRQWYLDRYVKFRQRSLEAYSRPRLPSNLTVPPAPTVLPFHTFTCPMSAEQIRLISQRNGLRISCSTLKAPWLPNTVFPPPSPPNPQLRVGYVSSDFNNHPLAHLMQSVFGMHNPGRVKAFCYATTASDNSIHRKQIESEAPVFHDASSWSTEKLVNKIVEDGIHILVNLNGYTRGARNEVFAARPAPLQMSFMGFAGTLGAEWCDYLLADDTAIPLDTLRPWRRNVDVADQLRDENSGGPDSRWIYAENIIFCKDTFFCCDHRQSAPDAVGNQLNWEEEQTRRWQMRKEIFPDLRDDAIILGNFNQLYKIEPTTFRTWLRILDRTPKAILWLLRFPDLGETNLKATATAWAGPSVASRILFTDVAPKTQHISRARVCDLFLDTPECNAHTTAADVLWSGTPLLTLPRYEYKMCSRMAASILKGALPKGHEGARAGRDLIALNEEAYEEMAVKLAGGLRYEGHRPVGRLADLRKLLYENRWSSALFDTRRWVRDLEDAYGRAWRRWVAGRGGDIWLADPED